VLVPTIKYCLREGLPRPGELTSPDQAQYDESHLRQLRLIRALAEVSGLSIAAIGDLLAASGSPGTSLHDALGKAQYATTPRYGHPAGDASRQAGAPRPASSSAAAAGGPSRTPRPGNCSPASWPPRVTWARTDLLALADAYAGPAGQIAAADLAAIHGRRSLDSQLKGVIIGGVLGDILLAALRRLAGEDASAPFRKRPPARHRRPPACRG
jgi:DNA-binding transcriptional MerR regulator